MPSVESARRLKPHNPKIADASARKTGLINVNSQSICFVFLRYNSNSNKRYKMLITRKLTSPDFPFETDPLVLSQTKAAIISVEITSKNKMVISSQKGKE